MSALAIFLSLTLLLAPGCVGVLAISDTGPVITLSYGSFQGNLTGGVVEFLGIPFAAPPYASYSKLFFSIILKGDFFWSVGNLRFAPPKSPRKIAGVHQATSFGAACPQLAVNTSVIPGLGSFNSSIPLTSEDCRSASYTYYDFN